MKDKRRVRGTIPTIVDGIKFHSTKEARRWQELRLLERAGEIANLERQVPIPLLGRDREIHTPTGKVCRYIADFRYVDLKTGLWVWEDAKGYDTDVSELKRAIVAAQGIVVRVV